MAATATPSIAPVIHDEATPAAHGRPSALLRVLRNRSAALGGALLLVMAFIAIAAPWLYTIDPNIMDPASAHLPAGTHGELMTLAGDTLTRWFPLGTDALGRDLWSRIAYGARVSLVVGLAVALGATVFGLIFGLLSGYFKRLDGPIMRLMDGLMAIPSIIFAIVLVAVWRPSLGIVILAIIVPETPPVARLVRSVVLSVREEPYVEAAVALDTPAWKMILRHILPNTAAPLIVLATFICAAAILIEAALSFLGIGLPPTVPTWGNIMAEGRTYFSTYPSIVLWPGLFLSITIFAVNILGDGLRDTLDPKFNKRGS